jgi:hypothetical protein
MTRTGACLCGQVRYAIVGELKQAEYCHCSLCRKAHGAAFSCNAEIGSLVELTTGDVRAIRDEDLVSVRSLDRTA